MAKSPQRQPIRVLIVDDSAVIRALLTKLLSTDPQILVVGTAADPFIARDKLVSLAPDVMTLDVEMPKMNGLTFLEKVMRHMPTATIIISALSHERCEEALRAMELGAVDVMIKPKLDAGHSLADAAVELVAKVKAATGARLRALPAESRQGEGGSSERRLEIRQTERRFESRQTEGRQAEGREIEARQPLVANGNYALDPRPGRAPVQSSAKTSRQILAIAASTGGTEALKVLLAGMPNNMPGTVIVQHMPPVFTKIYAETLSRLFPFDVKEAADGDRVEPGRVLLAPGNFHMELARSGSRYFVRLHQAPAMHGVRPAADYLLKSVAKYAGANAIGVVLTGMGRDGADGLLSMRAAGSYNFAQDAASCIVFGMPKSAIEIGAIHQTAPLIDLAAAIKKRLASAV